MKEHWSCGRCGARVSDWMASCNLCAFPRDGTPELAEALTQRALAQRSGPPVEEASTGRGVGGWLVIPLFGLALSIARIISHLATEYAPAFHPSLWQAIGDPTSEAYHPRLAWALAYEMGTAGVFLLWAVLLLWLAFRESRHFPGLMILYLIAAPVSKLGDRIVLNWVGDAGLNGSLADDVGIITSALSAVLWISYLRLSTRVRLTFVQ